MSRFILIFTLIFTTTLTSNALPLQKPKSYEGYEKINGWYMSEKLDGIRGYWNGKELLSKNGNPIYAPKWFLKNFPPFKLDGELWTKRGNFENIQSIVLDKNPSAKWKQITYNIFEVPNQNGNFKLRLQKAKNWFAKHKNPHVNIIKQIVNKDRYHVENFLKEIEKIGGEGVIIKNPKPLYFSGRSAHILKVKSFKDMEGTVIAINPGKGKFKNIMGSLSLKLANGVVFKLGGGFSLRDRKNPPKIGRKVTFKYYGFTKNKKPKFASFMRVRKKE